MVELTRKEIMVIICVTVFAVIWSVVVIPFLSRSVWFQRQLPPVQFLMFESGLIVAFISVLGLPISYLTTSHLISKTKLLLKATKFGLSAWIGMSIIFDLWEPPYYLSQNGIVLLNNPDAMTGSAVDAALAWTWQQLGIHGSALYYSVYVITPILLTFVIALFFTWKKFVKIFSST